MLSLPDKCGKSMDLNSVFESVGAYKAGKADEAQLAYYEDNACPGCGSCSGMFTANSMNCLTEVLGMGLSGNGTIPAVYAHRLRLAKTAGTKILELVDKNIRALDIMTDEAFENALRVDMALGCSTNSVLHLTAIAHEAGVPLDLHKINEISAKTPNLCHLAPAGPYHMQDLYQAGGVACVMKELAGAGLLNTGLLTATGKTVAENIAPAPAPDGEVVKTVAEPYSKTGGIAVLFGSLCPGGAVVKRSAVAPEMLKHKGPARVFDSEEEAIAAIYAGKINSGDVVVIRYEGPSGGPECGRCSRLPRRLRAWALTRKWRLLQTGVSPGDAGQRYRACFSGGGKRRADCLRDGGRHDCAGYPNYSLSLEIDEQELERRKKTMQLRPQRELRGYLKRYARMVASADKGATVS
jgi:dihydroxy-acid dehydratase